MESNQRLNDTTNMTSNPIERFWNALYEENVEECRRIMEEEGVSANDRLPSEPDFSALESAVGNEMLEMTALLLSKGALLNEARPPKDSLLLCAMMNGDFPMLEFLMKNGAIVTDADMEFGCLWKYREVLFSFASAEQRERFTPKAIFARKMKARKARRQSKLRAIVKSWFKM